MLLDGSTFSRATITRAQGVYYVVTGVWPLVSLRSFEAVSGPKQDRWLVRTVALLITVIGATLLGNEREPNRRGDRLLAAGSAASLATVDVYYVARRRISPVYLLDALLEVAFLGAQLVGGRGQR